MAQAQDPEGFLEEKAEEILKALPDESQATLRLHMDARVRAARKEAAHDEYAHCIRLIAPGGWMMNLGPPATCATWATTVAILFGVVVCVGWDVDGRRAELADSMPAESATVGHLPPSTWSDVNGQVRQFALGGLVCLAPDDQSTSFLCTRQFDGPPL